MIAWQDKVKGHKDCSMVSGLGFNSVNFWDKIISLVGNMFQGSFALAQREWRRLKQWAGADFPCFYKLHVQHQGTL